LFSRLYWRDSIESLPRTIDLFDRALLPFMREEAQNLVDNWVPRSDWGEALSLTINCAEELPYTDVYAANRAYASYPLLRSFAEGPPQLYGCDAWPVAPDKEFSREPVRSSVPTLILSGSFDPVTPPVYGRLTSAALANGYFFELSSVGHDVLANEACAHDLATMFLADPKRQPRAECLKSIEPPAFLPPYE
jgi:pimeloyl-ACP methyl ester carboxylesterase